MYLFLFRFIDSSPEKFCYYTDLLKEYFEGKWASLEKPFTYNERQMKKLGITDPNSKALRFVFPLLGVVLLFSPLCILASNFLPLFLYPVTQFVAIWHDVSPLFLCLISSDMWIRSQPDLQFTPLIYVRSTCSMLCTPGPSTCLSLTNSRWLR